MDKREEEVFARFRKASRFEQMACLHVSLKHLAKAIHDAAVKAEQDRIDGIASDLLADMDISL